MLDFMVIIMFLVSILFASAISIHNNRELSELNRKLDITADRNELLVEKISDLEHQLEAERINAKMLKRALLDQIKED